MSDERWMRIDGLLQSALSRPAHEREAFIRDACKDDQAVRDEVLSLLAHEGSAEKFLEHAPATPAREPFKPGTRLGAYEIRAQIGEGGMGEVYRAHDSRLRRDIALKILPPEAADAERRQRFAREAQAVAALNHPGIVTIHSVEQAPSTGSGQTTIHFLTMELVDGKALDARLRRGPLPVEEVIAISRQVVDALEVAHERGIIHRDLKPANIMVTSDGVVKILDFGLAKALTADPESGEAANSPTVTAIAGTEAGVILGTAAYMSPEQARGRPVDKRTDVWAFGCVVYELLTGKRAFGGETVTDTLASVIAGKPDWSALPDTTPAGIRLLLRRCLEKDPTRRLHDIADARIEIDDVTSGARQIETALPPSQTARKRVAMAAGLVAIALALGVLAGWALRRVPVLPETRVEISTPPTTDATFALSPDGRSVAFVATSNGLPKLWVRSLDNPAARPLAGTENAAMPFWSPDGKSVGFFADRKLKRVGAGGGAVETLASDVERPRGGTWGPDGSILYTSDPTGPLRRVAASGGVVVDVTRVEKPKETGHIGPQFLPGGRFIYFVVGDPEIEGVYLGDLDGTRKTRLVDADGPAIYTDPGYLVFPRSGQVLAQRFDPGSGMLRGDVLTLGSAGGPTFLSASSTTTFAYRTVRSEGSQQLLWVDRSGREIDRVEYTAGGVGRAPALSHDGQSVIVSRALNGPTTADLWKYVRHQMWDKLTFDPGEDYYAVWSHHDPSIIYSAVRNGAPLSVYKRLLSAPPESEQLLFKAPKGHFAAAADLSPDDKYLLFTSPSGRAHPDSDIWALSLEDTAAKPFEVVATAANERAAEFSPDGRWIAYESDKLGSREIFIRPFRGPGPDRRVSPSGGTEPRWNPMGGELFYIGLDGAMMAVKIAFNPDGTAATDKPRQLFPRGETGLVPLLRRDRPQYCVSPDGKWFVINSLVPVDNTSPSTPPIQLVLNWKPAR